MKIIVTAKHAEPYANLLRALDVESLAIAPLQTDTNAINHPYPKEFSPTSNHSLTQDFWGGHYAYDLWDLKASDVVFLSLESVRDFCELFPKQIMTLIYLRGDDKAYQTVLNLEVSASGDDRSIFEAYLTQKAELFSELDSLYSADPKVLEAKLSRNFAPNLAVINFLSHNFDQDDWQRYAREIKQEFDYFNNLKKLVFQSLNYDLLEKGHEDGTIKTLVETKDSLIQKDMGLEDYVLSLKQTPDALLSFLSACVRKGVYIP